MPIRKSPAENPISIKKQKEVRTRQWNFQKKVSSTDEKPIEKFSNVIGQLDQVEKQNDTLVERSLRDQNAALQERLRLRRENSINKSVGRMKNNNSNSRKNSEEDDQQMTTPEKLKKKQDLYGKPVFVTQKDDYKMTANILGNEDFNQILLMDDIHSGGSDKKLGHITKPPKAPPRSDEKKRSEKRDEDKVF